MSFFTAAARRVVNHRRRALTRALSDHARVLAHEVHGAPFDSKVDADALSTIFILHGLMGAGRNWRTFAKQLRQRLGEQDWRVVLVDLRGHGASASVGQGAGHGGGGGGSGRRRPGEDGRDGAERGRGTQLGRKNCAGVFKNWRRRRQSRRGRWIRCRGRVEADPHGVAEVLSADSSAAEAHTQSQVARAGATPSSPLSWWIG